MSKFRPKNVGITISPKYFGRALVKIPAESWWAKPMTREQFDAEVAQAAKRMNLSLPSPARRSDGVELAW